MKSISPVFMFHALYNVASELYDADSHYAITVSEFEELVAHLVSNNIEITSLCKLVETESLNEKNVCFTFDDGHISNYESAVPILLKYNASADFFINPAYVGNKGYIDWDGLRSMHASGMSIQSHGHHHYYFDDLDTATIRKELELSKMTIEDNLGSEVSIFAPPGGRITPAVKDIAFDLGYSAIATSRPGYWNSLTGTKDIPRLAVLANTSSEEMYAWASTDRSGLYKIVAKYSITRIAKKILGNKLYDRLRSAALSE